MGIDFSFSEQQHYENALTVVRQTLRQYEGCSEEEKNALEREFARLQEMTRKLETGRVEIAVFGEINTGKSALINALIGQSIAQVDVRGGWTKENWHCSWEGCGYCVPGFASSQVILIDTPGINEVNGAARAQIAYEAAQRADLILFVVDSDLNSQEFSALAELATSHKPIILVFNKVDLYSPQQRARLREVLQTERLPKLIHPEDIVETSADPLAREYVIEAADGSTWVEWRKPQPDVERLKVRILEVLEKDGKALLALNAALYAADTSDRIAAIRIKLRDQQATKTIWSFAVSKAIAVAVNPIPVADVLGGSAVDVAMVFALSRIYGIQMSWANASALINAILVSAGSVTAIEMATHIAASVFKGLTLGAGTVLTALPHGGVAGFGSYIVGQAAKVYLENGASWGAEGPKVVVRRILETTDKNSVLEKLKAEINERIRLNMAADGKAV
jgi:GTP-binding protein Era